MRTRMCPRPAMEGPTRDGTQTPGCASHGFLICESAKLANQSAHVDRVVLRLVRGSRIQRASHGAGSGAHWILEASGRGPWDGALRMLEHWIAPRCSTCPSRGS